MKCQYPNCEAEAKFTLGLADPDAEKSYYCSGHIDTRKREISMDLFTGDSKCESMTQGRRCYNRKKFGDYCGIHAKIKANKGELCICGHDLDFHGESCSQCKCEEFKEATNGLV